MSKTIILASLGKKAVNNLFAKSPEVNSNYVHYLNIATAEFGRILVAVFAEIVTEKQNSLIVKI